MTVVTLLPNTTSTAAALFKLLSGIDVLEACGCTEGVLAVLQGLTADSKRQGGLLRAPLAAMKEALVPLLLEGVLCWSGDEWNDLAPLSCAAGLVVSHKAQVQHSHTS